jgi:hypothetical protein
VPGQNTRQIKISLSVLQGASRLILCDDFPFLKFHSVEFSRYGVTAPVSLCDERGIFEAAIQREGKEVHPTRELETAAVSSPGSASLAIAQDDNSAKSGGD